LFEARLGGCGFGNDYHQKTCGNLWEAGLEDFPQSSPHFVANHSPSDTPGGDDSGFGRFVSPGAKETDANEAGLGRFPVLANPCKIPGLTEPGGFRKTLAGRIRPRCVLRSGPRHLLEAGVCGHGDGGDSGWPDRIWSSYGRGNRTAACACAWKADKCVS